MQRPPAPVIFQAPALRQKWRKSRGQKLQLGGDIGCGLFFVHCHLDVNGEC
jgi:hypothetical protein